MNTKLEVILNQTVRLKSALMLAAALASLGPAVAAEFEILEDTPVSFRANLVGVDTDPLSLAGNDFDTLVTDYWTVLVNLRGDALDEDGNATVFYEIQLTHTGSLTPKKVAPTLKTFLVNGIVDSGTVLIDDEVASAPNGIGAEYMATSVNIEFDPEAGVVDFAGLIAGDSDLDGDGTLDSEQLTGKPADEVVKILKDLKDQGIITGQEQGRIIKETRHQPK